MAKKNLKIGFRTLSQDYDTIDLDGVIGFSMENTGTKDALLGYKGSGRFIKLPSGASRTFAGANDSEYIGELDVKFVDSSAGTIEILYQKIDLEIK